MIQVINKQRLVFALTVSAFAFLGWQVYGLVVGENAMGQIVWHEQSKKGLTDLSSNENPNMNMVSATPAPKILSEIPAKIVQEKPTLMGGERIYMQLLNQYELAKMQRRLLEEEVGIASARSRIADFNQKTQKIVGQVSDDSAVAAERHSSLVLAYVEKLHGAWSATVNQDGEFEAVHVGSILADGRTVLAINDVGLTLQNGPAQEMLTFNGLKTQPVVEPSKAAPAAVPAVVATSTSALVSANTVADRVVEKPVQTKPEAAVIVKPAVVVAKPAAVVAKPKVVTDADNKKSALDQMLGDSKNIVVPQAPQLLANIAQETPMSNDSAMTIDQHILAVRGLLATQSVKDNIVTSHNLVTADKEPDMQASTVKTGPVVKAAPVVKVAAAVQASTTFSAAENDLLAASPQDYTIQLLGARDEAQLETLIRTHHLDQQAKIFHTSYLGGDWFVLVYGIFHSRPEAYVAIAGLNQSLHEMHPWVRQLGGIQMALHRMHKA